MNEQSRQSDESAKIAPDDGGEALEKTAPTAKITENDAENAPESRLADATDDAEQQAMKAELEEMRTRQDELLRKAAAAQNAMQTMQERVDREQERLRRYAAEGIAAGLLPVLDDLERALEEAGQLQGEGIDAFCDGLALIHRNWLEIFGRFGVERLTPERGTDFDPYRHEAMVTVQQEEAPPNTVWEVIQAGYLLHQRVLRPARVSVARGDNDALAAADTKNHEKKDKTDSGDSVAE